MQSIIKKIRSKNFSNWVPGYGRSLVRRAITKAPAKRHLLFSICDHYEPLHGDVSAEKGLERVRAWQAGYPSMAESFRDADGMKPRHSFFYPGEQYAPEYLEPLADLARAGFGEVELHLHHDNDTAENLRSDIDNYLAKLASHGHLSRDAHGNYQYAFIHGNWCLANARTDGRWCGVDNEMQLLFETGCYADFTFPSPEESQPRFVNELYWPTGDMSRRRAYDTGRTARVGEAFHDRLFMITGPLALTLRPGQRSMRIECSNLDGGDPPTPERLRHWVDQDIHVRGRPEWVFVKVHTHGAPEANAEALLGPHGSRLHECLAEEYNDGDRWTLHYVTAREMYNIARAAMDGHVGNPGSYRDYLIAPPPVITAPSPALPR